jgi:RNA polymerase sigma factor (sigma-70 family)
VVRVEGHILDRVCPSRTASEQQLRVLRATAAIISPKIRSAVLSGAPAPSSWKLAGTVFWHGNSPADAFAAPCVHALEKDPAPMSDDPSVTDLVTGAANGDEQAWNALVERYAPLVWSICRRHRLGDADADDVGQSVWLQLTAQLDKVRDPAALPGWLATTTRRECVRVLGTARRSQAPGYVLKRIPDEQTGMAEHELLVAERHTALREAFTRLPPCCQRLIAILTEDPPVSYAQISARLGIPVGSIGPSRGRCLDKLRRDPAIAALINAEAASAALELSGQAAPKR